MNYSKYIFTLILISFSFVLSGQVTVNEEPIVKDAMAKYKRVNASIDFVRAWRIQIITTDDRRRMEKAIRDFERLYPTRLARRTQTLSKFKLLFDFIHNFNSSSKHLLQKVRRRGYSRQQGTTRSIDTFMLR